LDAFLAFAALVVAVTAGRLVTGPLDIGLSRLERVLAWVLAGVVVVGSLGVLLSEAGLFRPWIFFPSLVTLCLVAAAARLRFTNPVQRLDPGGRDLWLVLLLVVLAVLVSRPFDWSLGGRDPGVYVNRAHQLARDGGVEGSVRTLREVPPDARSSVYAEYHPDGPYPAALAPGIYITDLPSGSFVPQFFPLYPVVLAYVQWFAGPVLMLWTTGLLAIGAVCFAGLLGRRLAGDVAGVLAVFFLSTNLIQLWFGRFPNSEVLTEILLLGGVWAYVSAGRAQSRTLYALAGGALGAALLTRPDAFLVIAAILAAIAWRVSTRTFERPLLAVAPPFAALAVLTGAESYLHQRSYLRDSFSFGAADLSRLSYVLPASAMLLLLVVGLAMRRTLRRRTRPARLPGLVLGAGVAGFGVFSVVDGWIGARWLSLYFTRPGLIAAWLALGYVVLREWRSDRLVRLAPLLLMAIPVAVVYLRSPLISIDLPWATRRYLPALVPILALALAVAGADLMRRRELRPVVLALAAALGAWTFSTAAPSLQHRPWAGSRELVQKLDRVLEPDSTVLLGPDGFSWFHLEVPLVLGLGRDAVPYIPTQNWQLDEENGGLFAASLARRRTLYLVTTTADTLDWDASRLTLRVHARIPFSLPTEEPNEEGPLPGWSRLRGEITIFRVEARRVE